MSPIYITDEAGNLVDLSKLFDRVKKLEGFFPKVEVPKTKRKKRDTDVKKYKRMIQNSYSK